MNFQQRISAFVKLGEFLSEISTSGHSAFNEAYINNNWFTEENIKYAINSWAGLLTKSKLEKWLSAYPHENENPKLIAVIMAGNIPLVGFHDLLCVLISGNKALLKLSDDDKILPRLLIDELIKIEPAFAEYVTVSDDRLPKQFDAVIATGSNNTNRYFEYYFRNKASLLRKGRSSVAVISGHETPEDLQKLAGDIFIYFGLGCRSVSKIYVPAGYDLATFFEGIEFYKSNLALHHKYNNNYHYHKAIFLMNLAPHLDNNFVVVKEDETISSPLGTLFYERYTSTEELNAKLIAHAEEIQCVVSKLYIHNAVPFGKAQTPELWDYADGVDTMEFLKGLG